MTRKTKSTQRIRNRKNGAFGGEFPKHVAVAKAKKQKSICENGITVHEFMEYADKLHEYHKINNDILESGLL